MVRRHIECHCIVLPTSLGPGMIPCLRSSLAHCPARIFFTRLSSNASVTGFQQPSAAPGDDVIALRGYRRAMVASMAAAATVPHFHFSDEVDLGALLAVRQKVRHDPLMQGVKLTFLPFMIKVSRARGPACPGSCSTLSHAGHWASHSACHHQPVRHIMPWLLQPARLCCACRLCLQRCWSTQR